MYIQDCTLYQGGGGGGGNLGVFFWGGGGGGGGKVRCYTLHFLGGGGEEGTFQQTMWPGPPPSMHQSTDLHFEGTQF